MSDVSIDDVATSQIQSQPHSRQAEEAVLGAILIDSEAYFNVAQFLKPARQPLTDALGVVVGLVVVRRGGHGGSIPGCVEQGGEECDDGFIVSHFSVRLGSQGHLETP